MIFFLLKSFALYQCNMRAEKIFLVVLLSSSYSQRQQSPIPYENLWDMEMSPVPPRNCSPQFTEISWRCPYLRNHHMKPQRWLEIKEIFEHECLKIDKTVNACRL